MTTLTVEQVTAELAATPGWEVADVSLEDVVLAYMGADAGPATAELTTVGGKR